MEIRIYGITHETLADIHDCFMPRTILTSTLWNNDEHLFTVDITTKASISAYADNVRIAMGEKHYDLNRKDFIGITIN